jgi:glycosyltransferase involved in cell wall biosynthesis
MNVLALVTYRVYPTLMGGQKGVALFYKYLQLRLNVLLVVSRNNQLSNEQHCATPILHENKKIFMNLFLYDHLKKLVRKCKPEVIIAEHSYAAWLALLLRHAMGIPYIIHSHNIEALRFREMKRSWWKLYWHYERWIHQRANYNFFISKADQMYAIQHFRIKPEKCTIIPYGIEGDNDQQAFDREAFLASIGIWENEKVFYFNGTLDYKPNLDAVMILLNNIAPQLRNLIYKFKIIVTGNRASSALTQLLKSHPDVLFLEYVPDVKPFYKAAHLFLNPVLHESGIKTKVIEALAHHCSVVSTESGARGIDKDVCSAKVMTVPDGDWNAFAATILESLNKPAVQTSQAFFDTYGWETIALKAVKKIELLTAQYGKQ